MSWGTELWDQYDQVCTHTDQGIEFVKRVTSYVEKRIHVEQSYAKDLRKLVKQFRKRDEEESKYTAVKAFSKLISETNDLAGQRELIAEYLQVDVMEPLKVLARDVAAERRKYLNEGAELLRQLRVSMETLERTKKQYEKASEEAENAQHALEKADNDPNSTKAKMDKLTGTLRNKETIAEECRNNYILQLEQTNAKRRQHYDTDMPQVFKNLQEMNGRRCSSYKELVASYADCHRKVFPVINTCLDNITEASNSVNPEQDNQRLIDNLKTGFPIPQDVAFEEYQGLQTKKVKKTPAKKKVCLGRNTEGREGGGDGGLYTNTWSCFPVPRLHPYRLSPGRTMAISLLNSDGRGCRPRWMNWRPLSTRRSLTRRQWRRCSKSTLRTLSLEMPTQWHDHWNKTTVKWETSMLN